MVQIHSPRPSLCTLKFISQFELELFADNWNTTTSYTLERVSRN
jgi:hypothetical protein